MVGGLPRRVAVRDFLQPDHDRRGSRWSQETYCYGILRPDDKTLAAVRVRVYIDGNCVRAKQKPADLVYGAAAASTERMSEPRDGDVAGALAFNGPYGMTPGAVVDRGAFWRGLWPLSFFAPIAIAIDTVGIVAIRMRFRRPAGPRRLR